MPKNRVVVSFMALNTRLDLLSNALLLERTATLVASANRNLAELLLHLGEVESRKLFRDAACSSMFGYCTERLGLSEGAAYKRITVARVARKFPAVVEMIADGRLHLSGAKTVAPVLTRENHVAVLREAAGMSARMVERLVVRFQPKPDAPDLVRRLPDARVDEAPKHTGAGPVTTPTAVLSRPVSNAPVPLRPDAPRPSHKPTVAPLSEHRFKIQFSASSGLRERLVRAQELMGTGSHDLEAVFEKALDALIGELERKKRAKTKRPQRKERLAKSGSRHIPQRVKREVATRDGEQCTFVDDEGRRCAERRGLEFHHQRAFARGGEATALNVAMLCRPHNTLEAEREFGSEHMRRARRSKEASSHRATATATAAVGEARPRDRQLMDAKAPSTLRVRDGGLLGTRFAASANRGSGRVPRRGRAESSKV